MRHAMTAVLTGGLLLAVPTGQSMAQPRAAEIDCSASHKNGRILEVSCYNEDSAAGTVDLVYVCTTPLDWDRRIVVNEPGFTVGGGGVLHLIRDCGDGQVVFTYQVTALTQRQFDDQTARQDQIRARRDRAAGR
ncbi:hypothetical protein [Nocardia sp. NPDC056100]|uniref:hypothetical protein n=1 Tax=Nocardia sp. NPDC056100 TaxID=3345712 RepID=UPI0035E16F4D